MTKNICSFKEKIFFYLIECYTNVHKKRNSIISIKENVFIVSIIEQI